MIGSFVYLIHLSFVFLAMAPIRNRKKRAAADMEMDATQGSETSGSSKKRKLIAMLYEEESRLGAGAYGTVVKARHIYTGNIIAIKYLRSEYVNSNASDLKREARFLRACRGNPYLVGYKGLLDDISTGELYIAMEYVGPSLKDFLREKRPLSEATVCSIMLKLLTGAKEMQECQIIHRDIKPGNILVAEGGKVVKICDLGSAMFMSNPAPYTKEGTMSYMAPEMLLGKPDYNALVDSWSLGCVMAELLTGEPLFQQGHQSNGIYQLKTIFSVLGLPSSLSWPEFVSLPLATDVRKRLLKKKKKKVSGLRQLLPPEMLSEEGFQVLHGLLMCNPDRRLTAAAALDLAWFAPPFDTNGDKVQSVAAALPAKKKLRVSTVKNVLRIPLIIWNKHHGPECSCRLCTKDESSTG